MIRDTNIPKVGQAIIMTWHISCTYLVLIKFPLRLSVKQCHKGKFSIIKSKEWSESNVYILLIYSAIVGHLAKVYIIFWPHLIHYLSSTFSCRGLPSLVCRSVGIWDGIVNPIYECGD